MSSYGKGTPAPDDHIDVGLQTSYKVHKDVPVRPAGYRTHNGADRSQAPRKLPSTAGYAKPYGKALNTKKPKGDSNYIGD